MEKLPTSLLSEFCGLSRRGSLLLEMGPEEVCEEWKVEYVRSEDVWESVGGDAEEKRVVDGPEDVDLMDRQEFLEEQS